MPGKKGRPLQATWEIGRKKQKDGEEDKEKDTRKSWIMFNQHLLMSWGQRKIGN